MRKLLALLVVLTVSGCTASATEPSSEPSSDPRAEQRAEKTVSASAPAARVSAAEPTRPYLLKGRLHVGREPLPGRYAGLVVRGRTWLAWKRWDGPKVWGTDTTTHRLPAVNAVEMSTDGRFIATVSGGEHCEGVGLNREHKACAVSLLDTSGVQPPRRLVVRRTVVLAGVSEQGVVILTEGADLGWDELMWDAPAGADDVVPIKDPPRMQQWAMHDWGPGSFGTAGFEFFAPNVSQRWLGEFVDGQVRPRFPIPDDVELGPGRAWAIGTAWATRQVRRPRAAFEATTPTLRARPLGTDGTLGAPVQLRAPSRWFFARGPQPGDVVFWEDADTFLARVVDSRQSGDRLTRCDLPLATCVLVD